MIVRGGQRIVKYKEGFVDLSEKPDPEILNFPTKSRWVGVAPVSSETPHIWWIRAQEGFYLEAILGDDGGIRLLNLSKGVEGRIHIEEGGTPPTIFGTTYDSEKERILIITSDGTSIKVSDTDATTKKSLYFPLLLIGIAVVVLLSVILARLIARKRRIQS